MLAKYRVTISTRFFHVIETEKLQLTSDCVTDFDFSACHSATDVNR